jgi:TolA protein
MKTSANIDVLHPLSQNPRIWGTILLSVGLHILFISAMFYLPNLSSTRVFYSPIYSVRLVNVAPSFVPDGDELSKHLPAVLPSRSAPAVEQPKPGGKGKPIPLPSAAKEDPEKKIMEAIERLRSEKEARQLNSAIDHLRSEKESRQLNSAIDRLRRQKEARRLNSASESTRRQKETRQPSSASESTRREKEPSQVSLAIESLRKETRQLSSAIESTRREEDPGQVGSSIEGLRKEARQLSSAIESTRRERRPRQVGSSIEGLRKEARQLSSSIESTRREEDPGQVGSSIEGLRKEARQLSSSIEGLRRLIIIGSSGAIETGDEGTGGASSAVMSIKFKIYYNLLWQRIRSVWVLSEEALLGEKNLETIIAIRIAKDGQIEEIQFEKKSGNPYLDASALRAIQKANPLPPLPAGMGTDKFDVGVRFTPSDL